MLITQNLITVIIWAFSSFLIADSATSYIILKASWP